MKTSPVQDSMGRISYRIDSCYYSSLVEHRSMDLIYMRRHHHFVSKTHVIDAVGPLWLAGFADLSQGPISVRSPDGILSLRGRYGFFAPTFAILDWTLGPGLLEWEAVSSSCAPPPPGHDRPFLFEWCGGVPRSYAELCAMLNSVKTKIPIDQNTCESLLAKKVKAQIDTGFMVDVPVSNGAKELGYDWAYISREFKKSYGLSPVKYRNRIRLFCAIRLLSQGRTVTEACFESGFNSLTQFNVHFKEYLGTQPTSYSFKKNPSRQS